MGMTIGSVRGLATSLRKKLDVRKARDIPSGYYAVTGEDPFEAAAWLL
jgi:hypothetical protein